MLACKGSCLGVVLAPQVAAASIALQVQQDHRTNRGADLKVFPLPRAQHLELQGAAQRLHAAEPP